jgi:hypothetical protein
MDPTRDARLRENANLASHGCAPEACMNVPEIHVSAIIALTPSLGFDQPAIVSREAGDIGRLFGRPACGVFCQGGAIRRVCTKERRNEQHS